MQQQLRLWNIADAELQQFSVLLFKLPYIELSKECYVNCMANLRNTTSEQSHKRSAMFTNIYRFLMTALRVWFVCYYKSNYACLLKKSLLKVQLLQIS